MEILNGKELAQEILDNVKTDIINKDLSPILKIYQIGENAESERYIEKKTIKANKVGIQAVLQKYPEDVDMEEVSQSIINDGIDSKVSGIIIQLPVKNPEITEVFKLIPVSKDVDGLNPMSLGLLWQNDEYVLIPATAKAIIAALEHFSKKEGKTLKEFLSGKNCLIINRSIIIGRPLSAVLLKNDATVTIAHTKTKNIEQLVSESDVIISATGQAGLLDGFKFKKDTVIIDSGFCIKGDKVFGDISIDKEFDSNIAYLSPVPNGIGPVGIACLLENVAIAASRKYD